MNLINSVIPFYSVNLINVKGQRTTRQKNTYDPLQIRQAAAQISGDLRLRSKPKGVASLKGVSEMAGSAACSLPLRDLSRKVLWAGVLKPKAKPSSQSANLRKVLSLGDPLTDYLNPKDVNNLQKVFPQLDALRMNKGFWRRKTAKLLQASDSWLLLNEVKNGFQFNWRELYDHFSALNKKDYRPGDNWMSDEAHIFLMTCAPPIYKELDNILSSKLRFDSLVSQVCNSFFDETLSFGKNLLFLTTNSRMIYKAATLDETNFLYSFIPPLIQSQWLEGLNAYITNRNLKFISPKNLQRSVLVISAATVSLSLIGLALSSRAYGEMKNSVRNAGERYLFEVNCHSLDAMVEVLKTPRS